MANSDFIGFALALQHSIFVFAKLDFLKKNYVFYSKISLLTVYQNVRLCISTIGLLWDSFVVSLGRIFFLFESPLKVL